MNIIEAYNRFPTEADCIAYLEQIRWAGTSICPYCSSQRVTPILKVQRYHCNNCNTTFSATVKTIFHRTHLPLQKWFAAISLILSTRRDISVRDLAKELGVNKNTAWYIVMRINGAIHNPEQRDLVLKIGGCNE